MRRSSIRLLASVSTVRVACSGGGGGSANPGGDAGPDASVTVEDLLTPPDSCAFTCDPTCEPKGYACPALADWKSLPHADGCGAWDGTFPAIAGKCHAEPATGEAAFPDGPTPDGAATVLPTGYRVQPAGKTSVFDDFKGQFPANVVMVPGSDLAVVVDGGIEEQSVRLVDTAAVGGAGAFVVGSKKYVGSTSVNYGAAVIPGAAGKPARLYVSGAAQGVVFAFDVDVAKKTLTPVADADLKPARPAGAKDGGGLDKGYYFAGLAASADGKKLAVVTQNANPGVLVVVDVDPASPTYRSTLQTIEVSGRELFTPYFAPSDATGSTVWLSVWDGARIEAYSTADAKKVVSIDVGKNPQAFALIGARFLAVVSSDDDSITLVDTLTSPPTKLSSIPVVDGATARGWAPSGLAWDEPSKRLYVTLAGLNAVAAFDVTVPTTGAPTLTAAGMLGTDWWPTALATRADGSLVVVDGKGKGTGANPIAFKPSEGDITARMRGSIQVIPRPDAAALTAGKAQVAAATDLGKLPGASKVDCGGAPYDFPIPETNGAGPSTRIKRVVFVVKENKTFDGVYGDLPGVNGAANLIMAPGQMEIFANQRKIAQAFTNFDNYYTSAEQSIQGHVWTSFARTTDFIERTWLVTWGRGFRSPPPQGILAVGRPEEGSVFNWLQREKVLFDDMGEIIGAADDDGSKPKNAGYDGKYPGTLYSMDLPDTVKGCYVAARARVSCDLKPFTYSVQPNDHTSGGAAGKPTPATYIAVGDEGLGVLLEGLSKSPAWAETLLIVTEDDPQDGGDHVDAHRTPLLMASPWIKRGFVAKGHYDISSVHKLLAHVYGKPYPNEQVARAALPLEAFSSTPDFTPYEHAPRVAPLGCNAGGTKMSTTAAMSRWDFTRPDEAPGIGPQIWEYFHPGAAPPARTADGDGD
ncbi:MAG: hypothetical protein NVSMB47_08490 [Polyangiales bacterium]